MRAGDIVKHGPSGETWELGAADEERGEVYPNGWPESIAKMTDCTMVTQCDDHAHWVEVMGWAAKTNKAGDVRHRVNLRLLNNQRDLIIKSFNTGVCQTHEAVDALVRFGVSEKEAFSRLGLTMDGISIPDEKITVTLEVNLKGYQINNLRKLAISYGLSVEEFLKRQFLSKTIDFANREV